MIIPRPIRFRAWTGTEMVPVESLHRNDGCLIWYGPGGHMGIADAWDHPMWTKDNPKPTLAEMKPVMQFTGRMDKNRVDIYEGDIILNEETERIHSVRSNGERFLLRLLRQSSQTGGEGCMADGYSYVILGNVFQPPDLLKS